MLHNPRIRVPRMRKFGESKLGGMSICASLYINVEFSVT